MLYANVLTILPTYELLDLCLGGIGQIANDLQDLIPCSRHGNANGNRGSAQKGLINDNPDTCKHGFI